MKKHLLLAATILSLAVPLGSALAEPPAHGGKQKYQFSAADAAAFTNARIAALKAGLDLTPAQEKLWPPLEATLREIAKTHAERRKDWREKGREGHESGDMIARLHMLGKSLAMHGAEMEKLADAAKPLYDSLDEAQKRRFGGLLHMMRAGFGGRQWGRGAHKMWLNQIGGSQVDDEDDDDNDNDKDKDKKD